MDCQKSISVDDRFQYTIMQQTIAVQTICFILCSTKYGPKLSQSEGYTNKNSAIYRDSIDLFGISRICATSTEFE